MSTTEPFIWTEARIVLLRTLWAEGLPTAQIGRRLEISKNAVVGKVHRLQLPGRPSPLRNSPVQAASARKPCAAPLPASACPELSLRSKPDPVPPEAPLPLPPSPPSPAELPGWGIEPAPEVPITTKVAAASRPRSCQWPHGDPGHPGFHLCGDPAVLGKPYCGTHCRRAYPRFVAADAA